MSDISEVEGYDAELANAARLKLSTDQIQDIQSQRNRYFNALDPGYRQQIQQGNYQQRQTDIDTMQEALRHLNAK
jgi:hypothetical protein